MVVYDLVNLKSPIAIPSGLPELANLNVIMAGACSPINSYQGRLEGFC